MKLIKKLTSNLQRLFRNTVARTGEHYSRQSNTPLGRAGKALLSSTPILPALVEYVDASIERGSQERRKILIEQLGAGAKFLTPEILESDDFMFSIVELREAAMHSRSRDKIRRSVNVLINGARWKKLGTDEFDEFRLINDELSDRELHILRIFSELQEHIPDLDRIGITVATELKQTDVWDQLVTRVAREGIASRDLLLPLLTRLTRTGLIEFEFVGVWGGSLQIGRTTPLFDEFLSWIELRDITIDDEQTARYSD